MTQPSTHHVAATARIAAPPARIYGIIADYRDGHPRILPPQFSGLTIEEGGVGAGTVIRFQVTVWGKTQAFRGRVSEPEPGRVLAETYAEGSTAMTTFTVDPTPAGDAADVTIASALRVRGGLLGRIERALASRVLRSMYADELARLAAVAVNAPG